MLLTPQPSAKKPSQCMPGIRVFLFVDRLLSGGCVQWRAYSGEIVPGGRLNQMFSISLAIMIFIKVALIFAATFFANLLGGPDVPAMNTMKIVLTTMTLTAVTGMAIIQWWKRCHLLGILQRLQCLWIRNGCPQKVCVERLLYVVLTGSVATMFLGSCLGFSVFVHKSENLPQLFIVLLGPVFFYGCLSGSFVHFCPFLSLLSIVRVIEACVEALIASVEKGVTRDNWQTISVVLKQQLRDSKYILTALEAVLSERLFLALFSFTIQELILLVIAEGEEYQGILPEIAKYATSFFCGSTIVMAAYATKSLKSKFTKLDEILDESEVSCWDETMVYLKRLLKSMPTYPSAWGLFRFSPTLLVSLSGSFVTYMIVAVQFKANIPSSICNYTRSDDLIVS